MQARAPHGGGGARRPWPRLEVGQPGRRGGERGGDPGRDPRWLGARQVGQRRVKPVPDGGAGQLQRAPLLNLAHRDGRAALRIVLVTAPCVSRSCENFPDGFNLRLPQVPDGGAGQLRRAPRGRRCRWGRGADGRPGMYNYIHMYIDLDI